MQSSCLIKKLSSSDIVIVCEVNRGERFISYSGKITTTGETVFISYSWVENESFEIEKLNAVYEWLKKLKSKFFQSVVLSDIINELPDGSCGNALVLVYRAPCGLRLSDYLKYQKNSLFQSLTITRKLSDALHIIHQAGFIHGMLSPDNIFIDPDYANVQLTKFGPFNTDSHPLFLQGCDETSIQEHQCPLNEISRLTYIAPEQTGRLNVPLDNTTDFYALGIIFYELCFGHPPYEDEKPMKLIHCHLAQTPVFPEMDGDNVYGQTLLFIAEKLLQKNRKDRYQSAKAITKDLEECLFQLSISKDRKLLQFHQEKFVKQFLLKKKFYGRDVETRKLENAFQGINSRQMQTVLISGPAGIGKTSLVKTFFKKNCFSARFISGKYDQVHRDTPYSAVIEAFRGLIQILLTEERIETIKERLNSVLGGNAQLIINLIPELELITGTQPTLPELDIVETQNRFNMTFISFIRVFCTPENSLVIFLDDLQWMDPASEKLLEKIYDQNIPFLFIIGAFRNGEIETSHTVTRYFGTLDASKSPVYRIPVGPLDKDQIVNLITDTGTVDEKMIHKLADILEHRTSGNPFLISEYLTSLNLKHLLTCDIGEGNWHLDLMSNKAHENRETTLTLLSRRIGSLGTGVKKILKHSACLGNRFEINDLAFISGLPEPEIRSLLKEAQEHNLIIEMPVDVISDQKGQTISNNFQFAHDWILLSAYQLIPKSQRAFEHYRIGGVLSEKLSTDRFNEKLFDITIQMNLGRSLIKKQAEKDALAEMNLNAARKSQQSAAYNSALKYLETAIELLGNNAWERCYNLALTVHSEALEMAFVCVAFDRMEEIADAVVKHSTNFLDEIKVHEIRIQASMANNQLPKALYIARETLTQIGESPPVKSDKIRILIDYLKTKYALGKKSTSQLMNLPEMQEPETLAAVRLYAHSFSVNYFADPMMLPIYVFRTLLLLLKYGNSPVAPYVYACYGTILCSIFADIDTGYDFGLIALEMIKNVNFKRHQTRTAFMTFVCIRPWKEHPGEGLLSLKNNFDEGLKSGDLEYAALSIHMYCSHSWYIGSDLVLLEDEMRRYNKEISILKQETTLNINRIYHQVVLNLTGKSTERCQLVGASYNEKTMFPIHEAAKDRNAFCNAYLNKMRLCFLFYEYDQAVELSEKTELFLDAVLGLILIPCFYFYDALIRLAIHSKTEPSNQKKCLQKVHSNQNKLKKWARFAPVNIQHKYVLVEAEMAKIMGDELTAMKKYDLAISLAGRNHYPNEEALAYELAGKFFHETGRSLPAVAYLTKARNAYRKWGASAKVAHLYEVYPQYLDSGDEYDRFLKPGNKWLQVSDLTTLINASEMISRETVLSRLMDKLMTVVLENAGARKGYLVLKNGHQWTVEAEVGLKATNSFIPELLTDQSYLPVGMVWYVLHTGEDLVFSNAAEEHNFSADPYVQSRHLKSALCIPIHHQGKVTGVLYLENNRLLGAFTSERVGILKTVSKILANAWARNQAEADVLAYQDQLRSMSSELILSEERERRRLAVALHDRVGHALSSAVMKLNKFARRTGLKQPDQLTDIHTLLDQTIEDIHTLTFELSPPVLYDLGLPAALDWLAEQTCKEHWIHVSFIEKDDVPVLDENTRVLMFQSARELLFNTVKHSEAANATLSIGFENGDLWITLSDDGIGFDSDKLHAAGHRKGGFGLFSIIERLGSRGGYLDMETAPGKGTRIKMVLPVETG